VGTEREAKARAGGQVGGQDLLSLSREVISVSVSLTTSERGVKIIVRSCRYL
jgi:hypothetical protein